MLQHYWLVLLGQRINSIFHWECASPPSPPVPSSLFDFVDSGFKASFGKQHLLPRKKISLAWDFQHSLRCVGAQTPKLD